MEQADDLLMQRVQAGEHQCFAVLAQRYQGALLRVAESRLGRRDWAEEVVQDTLLAAFRWRSSFQPTANFRTWLWTILLNQCRRHYRLRQREPRVDVWSDTQTETSHPAQMGNSLQGREPLPHSQLMAREQSARLESLLGELDELQADALRLRFFGGLKFREIADTMGCSLATAKNRVRWGLTRIAEHIAQQQAASTRPEQGD